MVVRVIQDWHDYDTTTYFIDPSLLNPDDYVENKVKEALESNEADDKYEVGVYIHADDCPEIDNEELVMGQRPIVKNCDVEPGQIANRVVWLTICFE